MKFIDRVKIYVKAGDGGDGAVAFRREKFVPKGGPSGGDGGDGGDIIFEVSKDINTLLPFRFKQEYIAKRGLNGEGSHKKGKEGKALVLNVPVGTLVFNKDTNEKLFDLTEIGQKVILAKGGKGGKGNARFKSSTNQAPRKYGEGTEGEEFNLQLELKLLADIGLVGFPNAGKSTLISKLSSAKPKTADYPFTTLTPVLGVVSDEDMNTFVMADIPGIIEGAHTGLGLGDHFLRHIERTKILVFLLDISSYSQNNPINDFNILNNELKEYNEKILSKKRIIVLNKIDCKDQVKIDKIILEFKNDIIIEISALTGEGLLNLKRILMEAVQCVRN